jgi:hypothetical protein
MFSGLTISQLVERFPVPPRTPLVNTEAAPAEGPVGESEPAPAAAPSRFDKHAPSLSSKARAAFFGTLDSRSTLSGTRKTARPTVSTASTVQQRQPIAQQPLSAHPSLGRNLSSPSCPDLTYFASSPTSSTANSSDDVLKGKKSSSVGSELNHEKDRDWADLLRRCVAVELASEMSERKRVRPCKLASLAHNRAGCASVCDGWLTMLRYPRAFRKQSLQRSGRKQGAEPFVQILAFLDAARVQCIPAESSGESKRSKCVRSSFMTSRDDGRRS